MQKKLFTIIFLCFTFIGVFAHSGKAKYHAIVDVDNSLSSMNALTMILANNEIEVLAVLVNDNESKTAIFELLKGFFHEGIPVYDLSSKEKAANVFKAIFENEPDSITYLGLNGLKNIAYLTDFNEDAVKLSKVVVCKNEAKLKSVEKDNLENLAKKSIPLDLLHGQVLLKNFEINNPYNPYLVWMQKNFENNGKQLLLEKELLPIYLKDNSYFTKEHIINKNANRYKLNDSFDDISLLFSKSLEQDYSKENKVFVDFPQNKNLFAEDVQKIMDSSMQEHGYSEWRACAITNELHGHLGIYAVIGAKMGIRIREYFRIGVDDVHINSYAGKTPPFSCLNDGLQVSTGGTIGHGLIEVEENISPKPAATFSFKNQEVYAELKPEYWAQIKKDIGYGVKTFGLGSEKYWAYVRKLALKYWHDWDRHHIFILN